MHKLNNFLSLSAKEKLLFFEALTWLLLAKLALLLLPFRRILPLLRQKETNSTENTDPVLIRDAIGRASKATLWISTCLMKSMAARWMLNRRKTPSHLALGMVRNHEGKLIMHAWIKAMGIDVVTKEKDYAELYVFD